MSFRRATAVVVACTLLVAACGDDSDSPTSASDAPVVEAGEAFPAERCADNKAAGTITYLSSFDFAASASIVDVLVAKQKGYFEDLCLDVEVGAGLASANYPIVAAGEAEFSSGGSFGEIAEFRDGHPAADIVALAIEGRTAIDALIVRRGEATTLADLRGKTIGVKGVITPSLRAMLALSGLIEGIDYETVPIDGYDPVVHIALPDIAAFAGYQSNEPGALDRAGIDYDVFVPADQHIPGNFGVLYSNRAFMDQYPTATEDFMRAAMLGLADAIADPAAASMIALDFIDNNGNPNVLSPDAETFRWEIESKLVTDATPEGEPIGVPNGDDLRALLEMYAKIGMFGGTAPDIRDAYDAVVLTSIYDRGGRVVWPSDDSG